MLEANIQVALQQQTIDLEDAIDIRNIKNIKMANELLKMKRKKRMLIRERVSWRRKGALIMRRARSKRMGLLIVRQKRLLLLMVKRI